MRTSWMRRGGQALWKQLQVGIWLWTFLQIENIYEFFFDVFIKDLLMLGDLDKITMMMMMTPIKMMDMAVTIPAAEPRGQETLETSSWELWSS